MNQYQLDFTKLIIADVIPVLSAGVSIADNLILADKIVVGGVMNLPITEINPILQLVSAELPVWLASSEFGKWVK